MSEELNEKEIYERELKRSITEIKINEFHEIISSQDYSALNATIKTLDYILVLIESGLYKHNIIDLLKEWSLICDTKRVNILDDMERCQPADEED